MDAASGAMGCPNRVATGTGETVPGIPSRRNPLEARAWGLSAAAEVAWALWVRPVGFQTDRNVPAIAPIPTPRISSRVRYSRAEGGLAGRRDRRVRLGCMAVGGCCRADRPCPLNSAVSGREAFGRFDPRTVSDRPASSRREAADFPFCVGFVSTLRKFKRLSEYDARGDWRWAALPLDALPLDAGGNFAGS